MTPAYDDIQLIRVDFMPVLKFEYFCLFSVHAWEISPEKFLTGFHYNARRRLCVENESFS